MIKIKDAALSSMLALLLLTGCGGGGSPGSNFSSGNPSGGNVGQATLQGGRILGMDVMDVKDIPLLDYATAYGQAISLGVREVSVSLDWSLFEPATVGVYSDPSNTLFALNAFYPTQTGDVTLVLRPLDTPGPRMPTDLAGLPYNSPLVISAFKDFLTYLHGQLPTLNASGKLKWIHVGNEIDAYLGSNSARWAEWRTFFNAIKLHIKTLWGSSVVVSSVVQYGALSNSSIRPLYLSFLNSADAAVLTYYPLNSDFSMKPTSVVATDFDFMTSTIATKPILLQECGYPSDTLNNSSETQQANFITAVFDAWDTQQNRINLIDFAWQYDVSEATVDQWVIDFGMAGQPNADKFKTYLWTLGLSNNDGTEKLALQRLRDELLARSWVQ